MIQGGANHTLYVGVTVEPADTGTMGQSLFQGLRQGQSKSQSQCDSQGQSESQGQSHNAIN